MAATTALREALNKGISSGNFIDTKIVLYSRRDRSGRVCLPRVLYANSHVLGTIPYFNDLLFGDFSESQSKDFEEVVDEGESTEDYGYLSDSDLEDDDEKVSSSKPLPKPNTHPSDPPVGPSKNKVVWEEHKGRTGVGKAVKISDTALVTFQAFLMYLYTGVIEFAPFGSAENRRSRRMEVADTSGSSVPRPSPKSIYRLADKYDVSALKSIALDHIRSHLAKCDITEESCSRFASQYDEIRSLYVDQLASTWAEDSTQMTRTSVEEKVDNFVEGNLEHATEALFALFEIAINAGNVGVSPGTSSAPGQIKSPVHWDSVKAALISSIRTGVFFDRKYWARHSKSTSALKPVYFSSRIMNDKVRQLDDLVKYLTCQNLACHLDTDINLESDCDGDSLGIKDESSDAKDETEQETRAVLTVGSFSAWKSLFFYRCTDEISFAPLKSQGVGDRLNFIRERSVAAAPPPCSPKSIYALASLLNVEPLCDSAFTDVKNKVTLDNVVHEIFSTGSIGQEKIMEMQWDLLIPNFGNPKTAALVKENMRHLSDGSSIHCADTLKLGLKKAFDFSSKTYVKLRCSNGGCPWFNNHVKSSSIGPDVLYCQMCLTRGSGRYNLSCTGCSYNRTGNYATCKSCGKKFM